MYYPHNGWFVDAIFSTFYPIYHGSCVDRNSNFLLFLWILEINYRDLIIDQQFVTTYIIVSIFIKLSINIFFIFLPLIEIIENYCKKF